jgi:hypothetical protein
MELDDVVAGFLSTGMEFSSKDDVQTAGLHHGVEQQQAAREAALLIQLPSQNIAGFDCVGRDATVSINELDKEEEMRQGPGAVTDNDKDIVVSIPASAPRAAPPLGRAYNDYTPHIPYSVSSLSTPASPSEFRLSQSRAPAKAPRRDDVHQVAEEQDVEAHYYPQLLKQTLFHSQPILQHHPTAAGKTNEEVRRCDSIPDKRFDPFKTFSGRLERQLSNLRGRPQQPANGVSPESKTSEEEETDQAPAADRYFDALEGPELDTLRVNGCCLFSPWTEINNKKNPASCLWACRRRRFRCCRKTRSGRSCCGSRSARSGCASA